MEIVLRDPIVLLAVFAILVVINLLGRRKRRLANCVKCAAGSGIARAFWADHFRTEFVRQWKTVA